MLRQGELPRRHEVHINSSVNLQAIHLRVDRPAVEKVAQQCKVDVGPVPTLVLQEGEPIQQLLRWVLVPTVARVDERGAGEATRARILRDGFLKPCADALDLRADDEDALADGIPAEHLDRIRDGLVLLERRCLRVEDIDLHPVELRGVPERLLRSRRVLHEDGVHRGLGVHQPEAGQILAAGDGLSQRSGLLVHIPLLLEVEVVDDGQRPALKWVLCISIAVRGRHVA
mmetsp:Transcript_48228/g.140545  ORF Transcript_48228/g.140545 Transcript_48228/m.140545 type:complete len:229 (-) Transcript_48228:53-739(-)